MKTLDINAKASCDGIFGLPFTEKEALVVYLPIPWDVTTSYGSGAHKGPHAILQASWQLDLFDFDFPSAYTAGLFMRKIPAKILEMNRLGRSVAKKIIDAPEEKIEKSKVLQNALKKVNELSQKVDEFVYKETKSLLEKNKIPVLVGGDHSTPFGAIKAYAEKYPDMGILHFDAHSDTRKAFMGFEGSHASILYNVSQKIPSIKKIVQVGIRDFCEEEFKYIRKNKKFKVFFDHYLQEEKIEGAKFEHVAKKIVQELPKDVYVTIDIDALDPRYCPNTGTPVPGGLDLLELIYIIKTLVKKGHRIVGFDMVEVAPGKNDEWDANVGMRLLYKMTSFMLLSQKNTN